MKPLLTLTLLLFTTSVWAQGKKPDTAHSYYFGGKGIITDTIHKVFFRIDSADIAKRLLNDTNKFYVDPATFWRDPVPVHKSLHFDSVTRFNGCAVYLHSDSSIFVMKAGKTYAKRIKGIWYSKDWQTTMEIMTEVMFWQVRRKK